MTRRGRPIGRAAVVGAGIGGLAAASALRSSCEQVVVIERDRLPPEPVIRPGVPQGDHLHNLLSRAQRDLDALLPGFTEELRATGCGDARVGSETHVFELGLTMPKRDLGIRLMCAPRPTIEAIARRCVLRDGGVRIVERAHAKGLRLTDTGAVGGLWIQRDGATSQLDVEVVVDASGATTDAPTWLAKVGRTPPREERARTDRWYVTVDVRRPAAHAHDPCFWLTFATPPHSRTGLVSPNRPGHWSVSVSGGIEEPPPASYPDVVAHCESLEDPAIAEVLRGATPVGSPRRFLRRSVIRHRFDLVDDSPPGFFALGDSVAVLDPLHGQGMSVAAWQAMTLRDELSAWDGDPDQLGAVGSRFALAAAEAADAGQYVANRVDEALAGRDAPPDVLREQTIALGRVVEADADAHRRYVGIWHMIEPAAVIQELLGRSTRSADIPGVTS